MVRRIFLDQGDSNTRPENEQSASTNEPMRRYEDEDATEVKVQSEINVPGQQSSEPIEEVTMSENESHSSASPFRFGMLDQPFEGPDHDERPIEGFEPMDSIPGIDEPEEEAIETSAEAVEEVIEETIDESVEETVEEAEQVQAAELEAELVDEPVDEAATVSDDTKHDTIELHDDADTGAEAADALSPVAAVIANTREDRTMANDKNSDTLRFGFSEEQRARLKVIGVGGAGSNAVDNMITSGLAGVEFIAVNTDMQALDSSKAPRKVQIGRDLTRGLGAGGDPMIGRASAEEDKENLRGLIEGAEMVFIAAGMGGGTGSGAAPIIAELAREKGILTVGIVTKPFMFEGKKRLNRAIDAIAAMKDAVDTLIVIPNNKLLSVIDKNASYLQAFRKADDVLFQGTKGISDIINTRGLVNVDFADAKAVMSNAGDAIMGIGMGEGEDRAKIAAEEAITSPLLDNLSIEGARGLLINITGNEELGMMEVQEAVELITERAGDDADVYFGIVNDADMGDKISVTVIATGFPVEEEKRSSMRVPEPTVNFRTAGGQGRPQTKVQSVRDTAETTNGHGNGTNGHSNGQNGHANGSNGHANGKNGHSEHHDFLRVEADPDVVMDSLADMSSIDMNDRDLPAFLRRRQQGR